MDTVQVSNPVTCSGNKYTQKWDSLRSGSNVSRSGPEEGVRMEDCARVHRDDLLKTVTVTIADGHGSVPAWADRKGGSAFRYIGGWEVARLVTDVVHKYIAHNISAATYKSDHAALLDAAYNEAQKECEIHTRRGARGPLDPPEISPLRVNDLCQSVIDGPHFNDLYTKGLFDKNPSGGGILDKVLLPHNGAQVVAYVDNDGECTLAEYGTTCTTLILREQAGGEVLCFFAQTGDSDVYLFSQPCPGQSGNWRWTRITQEQSNQNLAEVTRLAQHGMVPHGRYFSLSESQYRGFGIMPSRSLGHSLLSHHGITHTPHIGCVTLSPGDILIAASDGIWASYGHAVLPESNKSPEDSSADAIAALLSRHRAKSAQNIAEAIVQSARQNIDVMDNTCCVVIKMNLY